MRLKLDENLPATLAEALRAQGHDADTVPEEELQGASDADVFSEAQAECRILITQDLDFADTRRYAPGTHHGILLVRLATRAAVCCASTSNGCSSNRTSRCGAGVSS